MYFQANGEHDDSYFHWIKPRTRVLHVQSSSFCEGQRGPNLHAYTCNDWTHTCLTFVGVKPHGSYHLMPSTIDGTLHVAFVNLDFVDVFVVRQADGARALWAWVPCTSRLGRPEVKRDVPAWKSTLIGRCRCMRVFRVSSRQQHGFTLIHPPPNPSIELPSFRDIFVKLGGSDVSRNQANHKNEMLRWRGGRSRTWSATAPLGWGGWGRRVVVLISSQVTDPMTCDPNIPMSIRLRRPSLSSSQKSDDTVGWKKGPSVHTETKTDGRRKGPHVTLSDSEHDTRSGFRVRAFVCLHVHANNKLDGRNGRSG